MTTSATTRKAWLVVAFVAMIAVTYFVLRAVYGSARRKDAGSEWVVPPRDAWVRFESPPNYDKSEELADDRFAEVVESRQAEAQALLEDRAWFELSPERARLCGGEEFAARANGHIPVVLRAVVREPDDSGMAKGDRFSIQWRAGIVTVNHLEARKRYPPETRRAIIAFLPNVPTDAYAAPLTVIYGGLSDR